MPKWHAIVLAASRGTSDSMAQSYGVLHKCTIEIGGQAMISHVVAALQDSSRVSSIAISTETESVYARALDVQRRSVVHVPSQSSAPSSALYAAITHGTFPILVTTGDHALLTAEMVQHVCDTSVELAADFTVGLASDHVIQDAYPETKRTFFRFGHDRVSGCNLFTIHNAAGLKVLERWQSLERNRKQPWKLVFSFGLVPLLRFLSGRLTLEQSFATVSGQLGVVVKPLMLPFAEAAIDVDKPADKELAEVILAKRKG